MEKPLLEAFPLSHKERFAVERAFGVGTFKRFNHTTGGPLGSCYWNVDQAVRREGGSAVFGWQILFWPGLYVQGLHHALWKKPDGTIIDVTGKYPTDHRPFTTFVEDDSQIVSLDCPTFIPSKKFALRDCPEVRELFKAAEDQLDHKRAAVEAMINAGGRWVAGYGVAMPPDLDRQFDGWGAIMRADSARMGAAFDAAAALRPVKSS